MLKEVGVRVLSISYSRCSCFASTRMFSSVPFCAVYTRSSASGWRIDPPEISHTEMLGEGGAGGKEIFDEDGLGEEPFLL